MRGRFDAVDPPALRLSHDGKLSGPCAASHAVP